MDERIILDVRLVGQGRAVQLLTYPAPRGWFGLIQKLKEKALGFLRSTLMVYGICSAEFWGTQRRSVLRLGLTLLLRVDQLSGPGLSSCGLC